MVVFNRKYTYNVRMQKNVHIGKPIYPNNELSSKENMKMIRDKNYAFWKETYEKAYGKKLEYSTIKYDELPKYVEESL